MKITKEELGALDEILDYVTSMIDSTEVPEEEDLEKAVDRVIQLRLKLGK